jgi:hypothetical protein
MEVCNYNINVALFNTSKDKNIRLFKFNFESKDIIDVFGYEAHVSFSNVSLKKPPEKIRGRWVYELMLVNLYEKFGKSDFYIITFSKIVVNWSDLFGKYILNDNAFMNIYFNPKEALK